MDVAQTLDGKNVFNRAHGIRPRIKIGNWWEEQQLYDDLKSRNMENDKETSRNTIFDPKLDNKKLYVTTHSEYGSYKPEEKAVTQRVPKVSVIKEAKVNPYKTKKEFELHLQAMPSGHDLLNRVPQAKGEFETTNRLSYPKTNIPDVPYEQKFDEVVTKYNPTGMKKTFGRDTKFTMPLPLE